MRIIDVLRHSATTKSKYTPNDRLNHIIEDIKRKLTNKCAFLEELSEEYTEDFW